MIISHIAAMANNRSIGYQGDLPWKIPEDMKYYVHKTKGHAIVMGRKTFESHGVLPHRLNVIVTRQSDYKVKGAHVFPDIDNALEFCATKTNDYGEEVFISGGAEIYKQTLDRADRLYLTHIYKDYPGDTFYPEFDKSNYKIIAKEDRQEPVPFSWIVYERI